MPPVPAPPNLAARPASRLKALALTTSLLAASLVVALVLAEVAVRLFAPQQLPQVRPDIWMADDGLGYVNRPGVRTKINTGERTVDLFTDREGYRVGAAGRAEAPTRVLLIGDSFAQALQVQYEQSFAGLLQTRSPVQLGRPVAVRNAGTDGWDPNQYLIEARRRYAQDTFALTIVFIYLGNDIVTAHVTHFPPLAPTVEHHFRFPRRLTRRELVNDLFYPINDALKVRSHLLVLLKKQLHVLLMHVGLTAAYFPRELRRSYAESPAWRVTAEVCRDLADEARRHGSGVVVVLVPAVYQVDATVLRDYLRGFHIDPTTVDVDQPNRRLGEELTRLGVPFEDVLPAFRAAQRRGVVLYGTVDQHLSPAGNNFLEQLLAPTLARTLGATAASPREEPRRQP
jgi:hypothetical protein